MNTDTILSSHRTQPKTGRNYGVDFFRFLSMLYVLILHTLGQSGRCAGFGSGWFHSILVFLVFGDLGIWSRLYFCADQRLCGLHGTEKKVNYSNYIVLWLQVVAYGVGITLLYKILHPELVTKYDLFKMFFPLTNALYWYFTAFTAYTGLFLIMPVLNGGIRKCTEQYLRKLFVLMILVFSVFSMIGNRFSLYNGYSFVWLVLLYILGAIMKKCHIGQNLNDHRL